MCFSIPGDKRIVSLVPGLLFVRCPMAITRFIIAVAVNPVKRLALWLFAHIGKEISKGKPVGINRYTSAAIVGIVAMLGIRASSDHTRPAMVSWRNSVCGMAVFCASLYSHGGSKATTRLRVALSKLRATYNTLITTVATAKPTGLPLATILSASQDGPTVEFLSGNINHSHNTIITDFVQCYK